MADESRAQPDVHAQRDALHRRVDSDFTYHPPTPEQVHQYNQVREEAKSFAHILVEFCPPGREMSMALSSLEVAVMQANAAIARGTA